MSNLSDLLPAGGGGLTAEFVASGALPNGTPIILNANGTVTAVAGSSVADSVTSPVNYASVEPSQMRSAYDTTNNKVIICYRQYVSGAAGAMVVVGTVSSGSITFGTPVTIGTSISNPYPTFATTSGKVFISYKSTSGLYGVVGTVSGTSISLGSAATIFSGSNGYHANVYDPVNDKIVVAWSNSSTNGQSAVGTISGTSISFGTAVVFSSTNAHYHAMCYDSTNEKIVIASNVFSPSNAQEGKAVVGTVSGTSISFGSAVTFVSAPAEYNGISYDVAKDRVLISWSASSVLNAVVGSVSGTSISFGSVATFGYGAGADLINTVYNTALKQIVIGYKGTSSYPSTRTVEITGLSATMATPIVIQSAPGHVAIVYDPDSNTVNMATNTSTVGRSYLQTFAAILTNLTSTNFVGIPDKAYASGATATVNLQGGVSANQSNLALNTDYYIQFNGTLATSAGTPSVKAGISLSATSLHIDNGTIPAQTGNSGKNLTTNGTITSWAAAPTPPAAGMTLISTVTADNAATVDLLISDPSAYDNYILIGSAISSSGNGNGVVVQFKVGSAFQLSNYKFIRTRITSDTGSYLVTKDNVATFISVINNLGNATGKLGGFKMTIYSPNLAKTTVSTWESAAVNSSGDIGIDAGVGFLNLNSAVTGFRVYSVSSNISGTFSLYGLSKS